MAVPVRPVFACTWSPRRPNGLASGGLVLLLMLAATGCSTSRTPPASTPIPQTAFSLSPATDPVAIPAGGSGHVLVRATRGVDSTAAILLSLEGLPDGVTATGTIPAQATVGLLTIAVAPQVSPQTLSQLTLSGTTGAMASHAAFALTIAATLPASNLASNQSVASGGQQTVGSLANHGYAQEPMAHTVASSPSGVIQNRGGFTPTPTPSQP